MAFRRHTGGVVNHVGTWLIHGPSMDSDSWSRREHRNGSSHRTWLLCKLHALKLTMLRQKSRKNLPTSAISMVFWQCKPLEGHTSIPGFLSLAHTLGKNQLWCDHQCNDDRYWCKGPFSQQLKGSCLNKQSHWSHQKHGKNLQVCLPNDAWIMPDLSRL